MPAPPEVEALEAQKKADLAAKKGLLKTWRAQRKALGKDGNPSAVIDAEKDLLDSRIASAEEELRAERPLPAKLVSLAAREANLKRDWEASEKRLATAQEVCKHEGSLQRGFRLLNRSLQKERAETDLLEARRAEQEAAEEARAQAKAATVPYAQSAEAFFAWYTGQGGPGQEELKASLLAFAQATEPTEAATDQAAAPSGGSDPTPAEAASSHRRKRAANSRWGPTHLDAAAGMAVDSSSEEEPEKGEHPEAAATPVVQPPSPESQALAADLALLETQAKKAADTAATLDSTARAAKAAGASGADAMLQEAGKAAAAAADLASQLAAANMARMVAGATASEATAWEAA